MATGRVSRCLGRGRRSLCSLSLLLSLMVAYSRLRAAGRRSRRSRKDQRGDGTVTNAAHIFDCALANKLLPRDTLPKDQKEALDRLLTSTPNLPVKTRSGPRGNFGTHLDSDNVLDAETMNALDTGEPLSDAAFFRVRQKVAMLKGLAKDKGLSDDNIKALIEPLVALQGLDGTSVGER
jgi:hypothetical protein